MELTYNTLVELYEIKIYVGYRSHFVTKVEAFDLDGSRTTVYLGPDTTQCGDVLAITLDGTVLANRLKVTTQVSGYEQIDAVAMCGAAHPYPPAAPPSPPSLPAPPAAPPPCDAEVDLVMVLDNSGSVGAQRADVLDFARLVVGQFAMGSTKAQVGVAPIVSMWAAILASRL